MTRTLLAGTVLCLTACSASAPVLDSAAMQTRLAPVPTNIPDGKCALLLSPREEGAAPVFFQVVGRRDAFIALDKKQHKLSLKQAKGKLANGVWTEQELLGHRLTVNVNLRHADATNDGQHFRGVISLTKPGGWSNAIPIEGTTQCRSRN